jgi:hypothetical protein
MSSGGWLQIHLLISLEPFWCPPLAYMDRHCLLKLATLSIYDANSCFHDTSISSGSSCPCRSSTALAMRRPNSMAHQASLRSLRTPSSVFNGGLNFLLTPLYHSWKSAFIIFLLFWVAFLLDRWFGMVVTGLQLRKASRQDCVAL